MYAYPAQVVLMLRPGSTLAPGWDMLAITALTINRNVNEREKESSKPREAYF
jgi:hypothetical protein